mgnify:CR=1 FL=1
MLTDKYCVKLQDRGVLAVSGEDKISLDDRENWAYEHEDDIVKTVENPFDYHWWMTADKPFQALAWCYEFYGYLKEGMGFVTTLPVSADGSCNGLQHLSAILRDEQGGRAGAGCMHHDWQAAGGEGGRVD